MKPTPDRVEQVRAIHRRTIRRGARWWLGAIERVQSGDFDPGSWHEANAKYLEEIREDISEILDQLPLENGQGGKDGGKGQ
jgi:hypothetical protein